MSDDNNDNRKLLNTDVKDVTHTGSVDDTTQEYSNITESVDKTNIIQKNTTPKPGEIGDVKILIEKEDGIEVEHDQSQIIVNIEEEEGKESFEKVHSKKDMGDIVLDIINNQKSESLTRKKNNFSWLFGSYRSQCLSQIPNAPQSKCRSVSSVRVYMADIARRRSIAQLPARVGDTLQYDVDRNDFVRLVFTLVAMMLTATILFVCLLTNNETMIDVLESQEGHQLLVLCLGISCFIVYCFCFPCSRVFPCNVLLLTTTVCLNSYIASWLSMKFSPDVVLASLVTTTVVVLVCLGLACSSFDFTQFLLTVIVAAMAIPLAMMIGSLICLMYQKDITWFRLITFSFTAASQSVVLIIELQMVLGGKIVELGENEWVYAAYLVYNSIIDMFINFMMLWEEIIESF